MHCYHRDHVVDFAQVLRRELDRDGSGVLLKTLHLCCAGDRYDPRLLREHPRKRDLRRRESLRSHAAGQSAARIRN